MAKSAYVLFLFFFFALVSRSAKATSLDANEITSLLFLMKSLNESWYNTNNVGLGIDRACEWEEIGCFCAADAPNCNIDFISFDGKGLIGRLPTQLPFPFLKVNTLDLGNNMIRGSLTNQFVRSFPNLRLLKLGVNNIEGLVPYDIGNLIYLEELDLDGGFTQKQIYYDAGFLEANKNKYGFPGSHFGNQFTGQLPDSFRNLVNLRTLIIHRNMLNGPLSYNSIAYLQSLEFLDLSGNRDLNGAIPSMAIGRLQNLNTLYLDDCSFSGIVPLGMRTALKLEVVVLEGNKLSGRLDPKAFPMNMTTLDIHDNFFYGQIPETLSMFKRLEVLLLHNNLFVGEIPTLRLPVIKTVSVALNQGLCGKIPPFPNAPADAIAQECDKPLIPCYLWPARMETNIGKPCECSQEGQNCASSSAVVFGEPFVQKETCCVSGSSCESVSAFGQKACVSCLSENEQGCEGTFGRPSCCKSGLFCNNNVCKGCAEAFGQCGGDYFEGATCCKRGFLCKYVDRYFSQCVVNNAFESLPQEQEKQQPTVQQRQCQARWSQCGGRFFTSGYTECCDDANDYCFKQDDYYSQCRPKPVPIDVVKGNTCAQTWEQCGGLLHTGALCCAAENDYCFKQDDYYSQCRPIFSTF